METAQSLVLLAATITSGLSAGVFVLYAHTVMRGLRQVDDRTFVAAFQAIDRAIINPWFLVGTFFGAPVTMGVAALLLVGETGFVLVLAALAAYALAVAITLSVLVPRNDAIKAAGDPDEIDVSAVRTDFDEVGWARLNLIRVALTLAAFGLVAWALVAHAGTVR